MRIWAALLLLSAVPAWSQTNRGSISGTVFDATSSVIAGAQVTITSVGTNEAHKLTTSEARGGFRCRTWTP